MAARFIVEEGWKFIQHNPDIIYKGAPLALAAYFVSPLIVTTWTYLPWIWASYDIVCRIPPEWIGGTYNSVKNYITQRKEIIS